MYHGQPHQVRHQVRVEGSVESQPARQSQVNVVVNRQGHHMVHRDPDLLCPHHPEAALQSLLEGEVGRIATDHCFPAVCWLGPAG